MKRQLAVVSIVVSLFAAHDAWSQTLIPTSGINAWNDDNNWSPPPFPNVSGAAAIISAATADLTIDLGQPITIGSLKIEKATSGTGIDTTISGTATNTLTFDGSSTLVNADALGAAGTGLTTIAAPISFASALALTQNDNDTLDFTQPLSGAGGVTANRGTGGTGVVALSAANTYLGATTGFTGSAADDWLIVRLNHVNAIPATTNLSLSNSAILELGAGDFTRALGTGAGQIQFSGSGRNGWGAFGTDRAVNLGGNVTPDPVTWGSGVGQANFGQLVLGVPTSNATVDFRNPLNLNGNRNIRSYEGSAAIDGKISGSVSGTGNLTKIGDGVLSLAAANSYSGNTIVQGGMLRLDHQDALPSAGNLQVGSGGVLAIGADTTAADPLSDFARTLGTGAGQIQLTNIGTGGNQANAGFSAHGGNRSVVLSSGAMLTWGTASFLSGGTGTVNRHFILSGDSSDSTLEFKNPIDLAGAIRTVVARNGSANVDAKLSGVLSGTGTSGLNKDNPGTLELSAVNTYAGTTKLNQGTLLLTNSQSIPGGILSGSTGGNIEFAATNANNIGVIGLGQGDFTRDLGTGTGQVQFTGHGGWAAYSANRVVNLGGSSQLVTWGVGGFVPLLVLNPGTGLNEPGTLRLGAIGADATVDFQNPIDLNGGARTVSAGAGTATINGVLSGVISGVGGSLIKVSSGTLSLTGANTYDGGTTISLGRLLVSNTAGSGTGSGPLTVAAGTLGGTGSISGTVTVNLGAHIAPGESIESLDVGSLIVSSGSFLDFELGAPGSPGVNSDLLNVVDSGGLTLNGGLVSLTNAGGLTAGTYTLIDYAGTLGGSVANLGTPTGPAGFSYGLIDTGSTIDLQVTAVGVPGDYNSNGVVDGADYVVWRKGVQPLPNEVTGVTPGNTTPEDYDAWRARFGNTSGSGSGLGSDHAVPEPATFVSLTLAAFILAHARRKKAA